jgi:hypothetical protein
MLVVEANDREGRNAMHEFIAKHSDKIAGTLSGFDRLVFRGTLRSIVYPEGMKGYLGANRILLKDFGSHAEQVSQRLKKAALAEAEALGRPVQYLSSSQLSKEQIARGIAAKDGIDQGLICVLSCVEPCWSFEIHRNREARKLELVARYRKCLFLYRYSVHPELGFMNARIQTWFPFPVQICLNGREWLRRQMDKETLEYVALDNCFPWIADWSRAQELMNVQLRTDWPKMLEGVVKPLNPIHEEIFDKHPLSYYWTTYQSEWAIDVVFRKAAELRRLYPRLVHHGMTTFSSPDVIRYLGKRLRLNGEIPKTLSGEVVTSLKEREEGVRIKHKVNGNSLKLYDKAFTTVGSVLRAETTVQNGGDFRVYRAKENDPSGKLAWRKMRSGVADVHRRAEVSRKAAERYLDAFATVDEDATLEELVRDLETRKLWRGRSVRPLRPFGDDTALLQAVSRGEFAINGLRNRDLQTIFFPSPASSPKEARRRSAWVSRQLRLLRAHGLVTKVSGTHRYQLSHSGRTIISAILTALASTVRQLTPIAA